MALFILSYTCMCTYREGENWEISSPVQSRRCRGCCCCSGHGVTAFQRLGVQHSENVFPSTSNACSVFSPSPGEPTLGPCPSSGSQEPPRKSVPKTSPLGKEPSPSSPLRPGALKDTEEISDRGQAPAATCCALAPQGLGRVGLSQLFCAFLGSFSPPPKSQAVKPWCSVPVFASYNYNNTAVTFCR